MMFPIVCRVACVGAPFLADPAIAERLGGAILLVVSVLSPPADTPAPVGILAERERYDLVPPCVATEHEVQVAIVESPRVFGHRLKTGRNNSEPEEGRCRALSGVGARIVVSGDRLPCSANRSKKNRAFMRPCPGKPKRTGRTQMQDTGLATAPPGSRWRDSRTSNRATLLAGRVSAATRATDNKRKEIFSSMSDVEGTDGPNIWRDSQRCIPQIRGELSGPSPFRTGSLCRPRCWW